MDKCYWIFVEGTIVMPTTGLAYKNTSSLQCSIDMLHDMVESYKKLGNTIRSVRK